MTNHEIAAVFEQIADLLEFQGANPFRVRAYRNAARTIHDLPESAADIVADPKRSLTDIEGIGKDLAEKIATLVETGSLPMLEELLGEIPESVLAILRVPGLGPKRAAQLYHELKIATLDELREACQSHKVRELKGFGDKTEAAILQGLDIASEAEQRILWIEADRARAGNPRPHARLQGGRANRRRRQLSPRKGNRRRSGFPRRHPQRRRGDGPPGGLRRRRFDHCPGRHENVAAADGRRAGRSARGAGRVVRRRPAILHRLEGAQHRAPRPGEGAGLKINEYGVFRGEQQIAGRTEEEVYGTLDLPCFPPELREARREFEWADAGELPELIELDDIRGDLHMHSTWTDGLASIEEMAAAAKQRGLKYIAITDHSKRVTMVGGLDGDQLRQQWAEIDKLNKRLSGITVLKGVEVDILERGGLDLPDDVLAEADWVVASVHYGQKQSREQITGRVLDALQNPFVSAIAHPTGPNAVGAEALRDRHGSGDASRRDNGKMLELNAHPQRLDLDDVACAAAKSYGIPIVISTDAHRPDGLDAMRCGVQQARRGGLTKADVANTRTWPQIKKLLQRE